MTKLDITKCSKYELNFKLLEKDSSGCSIFILSMFLVLHRAHVMALFIFSKHSQPILAANLLFLFNGRSLLFVPKGKTETKGTDG